MFPWTAHNVSKLSSVLQIWKCFPRTQNLPSLVLRYFSTVIYVEVLHQEKAWRYVITLTHEHWTFLWDLLMGMYTFRCLHHLPQTVSTFCCPCFKMGGAIQWLMNKLFQVESICEHMCIPTSTYLDYYKKVILACVGQLKMLTVKIWKFCPNWVWQAGQGPSI